MWSAHIHGMRWFWAAVVILVLAAVDRAYMDGQNMAMAVSAMKSIAAFISRHVDDLLRYLRR
jgi:hypothetical protein